jgi:hypothetical protein
MGRDSDGGHCRPLESVLATALRADAAEEEAEGDALIVLLVMAAFAFCCCLLLAK